jgi:hypothetical protein
LLLLLLVSSQGPPLCFSKSSKSSKSKKSNPKTNFLYFHFHFRKYGMSSVIRMYGFKPEESSEELATSSIFGIFVFFVFFWCF